MTQEKLTKKDMVVLVETINKMNLDQLTKTEKVVQSRIKYQFSLDSILDLEK